MVSRAPQTLPRFWVGCIAPKRESEPGQTLFPFAVLVLTIDRAYTNSMLTKWTAVVFLGLYVAHGL